MYVGTYTGHGSEGIYLYGFDSVTGRLDSIGLAAKTENPSFLEVDSRRGLLFAVNETSTFGNSRTGAVSVFSMDNKTGMLKLHRQVSSLGADPAHLSCDRSGRVLFVANYSGGNFAVFPVGTDGEPGKQTAFIQNTGGSADPDRQRSPHPHFIRATPDNRFVLVADLGTDQVMVFRFDSVNGTLTHAGNAHATVAPGSGPRHIAFSPSGKSVYVLNELSSSITRFSFDTETGSMQELQNISALPPDFSGNNTSAEIVADHSGRFLYVSNRGANNIGIFAINPVDGSLTSAGWTSCGGELPRNFEIDPAGRWLIVANQGANNIVIFRIDPQSGRISQLPQRLKISSPVCIRFVTK